MVPYECDRPRIGMQNLIANRLRLDVDETTDVVGHTGLSRVITLDARKTSPKTGLVDGLEGSSDNAKIRDMRLPDRRKYQWYLPKISR
jgi:hypothetical protein